MAYKLQHNLHTILIGPFHPDRSCTTAHQAERGKKNTHLVVALLPDLAVRFQRHVAMTHAATNNLLLFSKHAANLTGKKHKREEMSITPFRYPSKTLWNTFKLASQQFFMFLWAPCRQQIKHNSTSLQRARSVQPRPYQKQYNSCKSVIRQRPLSHKEHSPCTQNACTS